MMRTLTRAQLPNITQAMVYWDGTVSMSGNRIDEQLCDSREESAMTPTVQGKTLVYGQDGQEYVLTVDTAAWFAWLETASTFSFGSSEGRFTSRHEQAGHKCGGWYWKRSHPTCCVIAWPGACWSGGRNCP